MATLVLVVAPAHAADPAAPPGARADWLPAAAWAQQQWLPYDEGRMLRGLKTDRAGLGVWVAGDRRPLRALAIQNGVDSDARAHVALRLQRAESWLAWRPKKQGST